MNGDGRGLFPELTPPPGGIQRLRKRLDEETAVKTRPVRRRIHAASAATALGAVALSLLLLMPLLQNGRSSLRVDSELNPALIRLGVVDAGREPVTVPHDHRRRVAVERVDLNSSRVVFYRVAVVPEQEPAPE